MKDLDYQEESTFMIIGVTSATWKGALEPELNLLKKLNIFWKKTL